MKKHEDYITHIKNEEDRIYLKTKHFPVNMRLFHASPEYKAIILQQCNYIRQKCLEIKEGYKKPHGMSSANCGLSFNIIGITRNRNRKDEYCQIMINPEINYKKHFFNGNEETTLSNCGSLTLKEPIKVKRRKVIEVSYFDENGDYQLQHVGPEEGSFTIQHEVDHNLGILITDYK